MQTSRITRMNLSDMVYDKIKEGIVRWEFRPGDRLIDGEVAELYGVSRSLVRSAMSLLVNEGLIEVVNRRFYVARFSQKDIRDVLELRRMLEMSAFKTAMEQVSDQELDDLLTRMADAEQEIVAGDLEQFYALDVETHRLIIEKGANNYIKKVYANLQTILRMVIRSDFDKHRKITEAFSEHMAFLNAWKSNDGEAATAAFDRHLEGAEERVMENFSQSLANPENSSTGSVLKMESNQ